MSQQHLSVDARPLGLLYDEGNSNVHAPFSAKPKGCSPFPNVIYFGNISAIVVVDDDVDESGGPTKFNVNGCRPLKNMSCPYM